MISRGSATGSSIEDEVCRASSAALRALAFAPAYTVHRGLKIRRRGTGNLRGLQGKVRHRRFRLFRQCRRWTDPTLLSELRKVQPDNQVHLRVGVMPSYAFAKKTGPEERAVRLPCQNPSRSSTLATVVKEMLEK